MEHPSRSLWRLLETIHAVVYFAPEGKPTYERAGCKGGWMGYFGSRAAAMGPVSAEIVTATFFNFHPAMVHKAVPDVWTLSSPERMLQARLDVADAAVRRLLGDGVDDPGLRTAASLVEDAMAEADGAGRPLFAAHAALPWPSQPHLALWHGATLYREYRGDAHVASLVAAGIGGCEAHLLQVAAGAVPRASVAPFRGWSDADWDAASEALVARGLLGRDGALTRAGTALKREIEDRTDHASHRPPGALGEAGLAEVGRLLAPTVAALAASMPFPNPIGLPVGPPESHDPA